MNDRICEGGTPMKMIMAIMHKEDEIDTVEELNKAHFFVTKLATTGGFLKSKNTTIMIGVEDEQVEEALRIIKENAGKRQGIQYSTATLETGGNAPMTNMAMPIQAQIGGCTTFVLDVDQFQKF